jgi:hypothetical protein
MQLAVEETGYFATRGSLGPDVDGDGRGDVLVHHSDESRSLLSGANGELIAQLTYKQRYQLGVDADGDGAGDLIMSTGGETRNDWRVRLYSGAEQSIINEWPGARFEHDKAPTFFLGPDADGDHLGDVVIAHVANPDEGIDSGVSVYSGKTGKLIVEIDPPSDEEQFAGAILGADADGDGLADIVAYNGAASNLRGKLYFYGSCGWARK